MKIKIIILITALFTFISCSKSQKQEYLYLNQLQLKPLGLELNDNGLFYKNMNPNWKEDNERFCMLAFRCEKDNYLTSTHFTEADFIDSNKKKTTLSEKNYTKNDFYPLLISNTKGDFSLDNYSVMKKEIKLLPIAVCMSQAKNTNRKDTLIVWFKPTASLKKVLPDNINLDDYLKIPKE